MKRLFLADKYREHSHGTDLVTQKDGTGSAEGQRKSDPSVDDTGRLFSATGVLPIQIECDAFRIGVAVFAGSTVRVGFDSRFRLRRVWRDILRARAIPKLSHRS